MAAPVMAQQKPLLYGPAVTLAQAKAIVAEVEKLARARGLNMAVNVVIPSGEPVMLQVMDNTQFASITIAQRKARTAALFRTPTKFFGERLAAGWTAVLSVDDLITIDGGIPIVSKGAVIGGLGVSGGSPAEDLEVATAALAAAKLD